MGTWSSSRAGIWMNVNCQFHSKSSVWYLLKLCALYTRQRTFRLTTIISFLLWIQFKWGSQIQSERKSSLLCEHATVIRNSEYNFGGVLRSIRRGGDTREWKTGEKNDEKLKIAVVQKDIRYESTNPPKFSESTFSQVEKHILYCLFCLAFNIFLQRFSQLGIF